MLLVNLHQAKPHGRDPLVNGLIFGAIMGVIAAVWFDKGMLGVVISLSMVTNLFFAGFFWHDHTFDAKAF